jgi:hypothetical protein
MAAPNDDLDNATRRIRLRDIRSMSTASDPQQLFETAARGDLGLAALAYVARSKHPAAQAILANRPQLSRWQRVVIVAIGGSHSAAWVVTNDRSRLVRVAASFRFAEAVLVARLRQTTSQWLLFRSSFRGHFAIVMTVALNPAAGRRTRARLMNRPWWGVRHALARRTDLTTDEYARIWGHPAVSLMLAANPSIGSVKADELAQVDDPFVSKMASVHPARPIEVRAAVGTDPETPAWVLHRLLLDPSLPPDLDERVRVWLALGGGAGDPSFDPLECTGTPGDNSTSREAAYRAINRSDPTNSPLWFTRSLSVVGSPTLSKHALDRLSTDGDPRVRLVAARYRSKEHLNSLRLDPVFEVASLAENTIAGGSIVSLTSKRRAFARGLPRWMVPIIIAGITLATHGAFSNGSSGSSDPIVAASLLPDFTLPSVPGEAVNPIGVQLTAGTWESNVERPKNTPSCSAGNNRVWVTIVGDTTHVTITTDNASTAVRFIQLRTGVASIASDQLLSRGQVGRFSQNIGRSDLLVVAIGDRPENSFTLDGLNAGDVAFPDRGGDC